METAIKDYGSSKNDIAITVTENFNITTNLTIPANAYGKNLTIKGDVATRTLTRNVNTNLFTINGSAKLVFENIIVDGNKDNYSYNTSSLVYIDGGEFTMKGGAVLTNNHCFFSDSGSGVLVNI